MFDMKLLEEFLPNINNLTFGKLKELEPISKAHAVNILKDISKGISITDIEKTNLCLTVLMNMQKTNINKVDLPSFPQFKWRD